MSDFPDATVVASETEVSRAYDRLAEAVQPYVNDGDCILLGIMVGGMVPLVKLAEMLTGDFAMDYCQVSRYRGTEQGGALEWLRAPALNLAGQTVVLIDDIYDEGITLEYAAGACRALDAARVITAVLVRKQHDRNAGRVPPDFFGLGVADDYVFGCGMDYRHRWRHLRAIYALRERR